MNSVMDYLVWSGLYLQTPVRTFHCLHVLPSPRHNPFVSLKSTPLQFLGFPNPAALNPSASLTSPHTIPSASPSPMHPHSHPHPHPQPLQIIFCFFFFLHFVGDQKWDVKLSELILLDPLSEWSWWKRRKVCLTLI